MSKLIDCTKPSEDVVQTLLMAETEQEAKDRWSAVQDAVIKELSPYLQNWLNSYDIVKRLEDCKTMDEMEKLDVHYMPAGTPSTLIDSIDKHDIPLPAKGYMYGVFMNTFYQRGKSHIDKLFMQRAREIQKPGKKKSRIITDI